MPGLDEILNDVQRRFLEKYLGPIAHYREEVSEEAMNAAQRQAAALAERIADALDATERLAGADRTQLGDDLRKLDIALTKARSATDPLEVMSYVERIDGKARPIIEKVKRLARTPAGDGDGRDARDRDLRELAEDVRLKRENIRAEAARIQAGAELQALISNGARVLTKLDGHQERGEMVAELRQLDQALAALSEAVGTDAATAPLIADLDAALAAAAIAEKRADARAECLAILADRQRRVAELSNVSGMEEVDQAIAAVKGFLQGAETDVAGDDFTGALAKLKELTIECAKVERFADLARRYAEAADDVVKRRDALRDNEKGLRDSHKDQLKEIDDMIVRSSYFHTLDYGASARIVKDAKLRVMYLQVNVLEAGKAQKVLDEMTGLRERSLASPGEEIARDELKLLDRHIEFAGRKIEGGKFAQATALAPEINRLQQAILAKSPAGNSPETQRFESAQNELGRLTKLLVELSKAVDPDKIGQENAVSLADKVTEAIPVNQAAFGLIGTDLAAAEASIARLSELVEAGRKILIEGRKFGAKKFVAERRKQLNDVIGESKSLAATNAGLGRLIRDDVEKLGKSVALMEERGNAGSTAAMEELARMFSVECKAVANNIALLQVFHFEYGICSGKLNSLGPDIRKNEVAVERLDACERSLNNARRTIMNCENEPSVVKERIISEARALIAPLSLEIDGAKVDALEAVLGSEDYADERGYAMSGLSLLESDQDSAAILHHVKAVTADIARADELAAQHNYDQAKSLVEPILLRCQEVVAHAAAHAEYRDAVAAMENDPAMDGTDIGEKIALANKLLAKLVKYDEPGCLGGIPETITALIERATLEGTGEQFTVARATLAEAFQQLSEGHNIVDRRKRFNAIEKLALDDLAKIETVDRPEFKVAALQIRARAELAGSAADKHFLDRAITEIEAARTRATDVLAAAKITKDYLVRREAIEKRIVALAGHNAKFAVNDILREIEEALDGTDKFVSELNPVPATTRLDAVERLCDTAELRAKMHGGETPDPRELVGILSGPDGAQRLDSAVKGLDAKTQRKVFREAFQKRFNVDLTMLNSQGVAEDLPDQRAPDILKLYEILSAVPARYTIESDSLRKIERKDAEGTSLFDPSEKEIKLAAGRAGDAGEWRLMSEAELPDVDEEFRIDAEGAPLFTWTTLHEIGHSIDDKATFMASKGKSKDHGSWIEYGTDVSKVAEAAARKFDYDKTYIEAYLLGVAGTAQYPVPSPGDGDDAAELDQRRAKAEDWCDAIRRGKELWNNGAEAKKRAIDGRVYQQSYDNQWTSYLYDARKQGVTGYQFRAPGEWFAELYAAYHTGALPETHPACKFLGQFGERMNVT